MTAEQFAYWLQGYFEMSNPNVALTAEQTKMVREHLATVFTKVTPPLAPSAPTPPIHVGTPMQWLGDRLYKESPEYLRTTITCDSGINSGSYC